MVAHDDEMWKWTPLSADVKEKTARLTWLLRTAFSLPAGECWVVYGLDHPFLPPVHLLTSLINSTHTQFYMRVHGGHSKNIQK